MNEENKQLAEQIIQTIKSTSKIVLTFHTYPDADSVGGTLALYHALRSLGKEVTIFAGDQVKPQSMKSLPGWDQVVQKNFFEMDFSEFDLLLISDTSSPDKISQLKEVSFPPNLQVIVIDHHLTNTKFGHINLIDDSYIACCEMLFDLFTLWGVEITREIAINLFVGIQTDSGGFRHEKTTAHTFEVAASLAKIAPDFSQYLFEIENSKDPESLKFQAIALNSLEYYFENNLVIAAVPFAKISGIKEENMGGGIADKLVSVIGWNITALLVEKKPGQVFVSMRTRDAKRYNLTKLVVPLGGGGHPAAAGVTLNQPFEEAKQRLISAVQTNLL